MEIEKRIKEFSKDELARLKSERKDMEAADKEAAKEEPKSSPIDIYQQNVDRIRDVNKKSFPNGSSAIVNTAVNAVTDGVGAEGLIKAFNRTKEDIEALKNRGERGRVELRRKQYMEEAFLPAVEIVVNSTSPDEVLNSKSALNELDKYALLEGSGKGYTASYIRQAYGNQLGQVNGRSDDSVRSGVQKLNMLLDDGQVRTAFGLAGKLKEQIDRGEHIADDDDYDLICRIVAYYS